MLLLRRPCFVTVVSAKRLLLRPDPRQVIAILGRAMDMTDGIVDHHQIDKHQEKRHCLPFITPEMIPDGHKVPF